MPQTVKKQKYRVAHYQLHPMRQGRGPPSFIPMCICDDEGGKASLKGETADDLERLVIQVQGLGLDKNKIGSGTYGMVHAVTVRAKNV